MMLPEEQSVTSIILSSSFLIRFYKIHYFLWFASLSGVLPYYVVFVRTYTSASASWIGTLFSVLPFIAFLTNPFFCSLADKSSNHLKYLLIFIGLTCVGYGTLMVLPKVSSPLVSWSLSFVLLLIAYPSMATVTSLTDSIVMMMVTSPSTNDQNKRNRTITFGHIRVWGTVGYGIFGFLSGPINSINFGQGYLQFGFFMFIIICSIDFVIVATTLTLIYLKRKRPQSTYGNEDCLVRIEGQDEQRKWINEKETEDGFRSRKNDHQAMVALVHHDNRINNDDCGDAQLTSAHSERQPTDHWSSFVTLFIEHPTIIQHTIILIGQGILMSCHWSFFYWYLETISGSDTFLMGLTLLIGCFFGELTFFYFGNSIVNRVGPSNSFNISLIAFTIQYFTYAYVITSGNQYLVCLTEILQGPTFGLFYTSMTHIGQHYADKLITSEPQTKSIPSLYSPSSSTDSDDEGKAKVHATLQGFLSGCLEGLGLGLGSLGAGLIIDHYGVRVMWTWAGTLAVILLTFNVSIQMVKKLITIE